MSERRTGFIEAAEFIVLKDELAQCRELSELRLQSEQAFRAERDEYVQMWRAGCDDRAALSKEVEELRAALEEMIAGEEAAWSHKAIMDIARRALEEK